MSDLLLLSGGIDSVALAAWLKPEICLTIDYGQNAAMAEILASKQVCSALGLTHAVVTATLDELAAGEMSNHASCRHSPHAEFWPFRNQLLATLGAMYSVKHGYRRVLIGTVSTDSRHRDGTSKFVSTLDTLMHRQEGEIRYEAPAISMTSGELVRQSGIEASVLGWAHSCYLGNLACGRCGGCLKHSEVLQSLGWER